MSLARVVVVVIATLIGLVAAALLIGGIALAVVYGTQRDDDGFFTSPTYDLRTNGHALVSEDLDLASRPGDWWPSDLATVRFDVESEDTGPVFVGIGPTSQVNQYLSDVARDEITDLGDDGDEVTYRPITGGEPETPPGAQTFWAASSEGLGEQSVTWDVESGNWTVVVMNADSSSPVEVAAEAGAQIETILWIAIGLIVVGLLAGMLAIVLIVLATRQRGRRREVRVA